MATLGYQQKQVKNQKRLFLGQQLRSTAMIVESCNGAFWVQFRLQPPSPLACVGQLLHWSDILMLGENALHLTLGEGKASLSLQLSHLQPGSGGSSMDLSCQETTYPPQGQHSTHMTCAEVDFINLLGISKIDTQD